jgi:hypothetical protein
VDPAFLEFVQAARTPSDVTNWNDASRISLRRRYVMIAVPKVGCSTLKLAVHLFEDPDHPVEWWQTHDDWPGWSVADQPDDVAVAALSSPDWFRFCFVRNPYDRLVSAFKSKLSSDSDEYYQWLRDAVRERYGRIDFAESFDFLAADYGRRDPHWRPQVELLHPEVIAYDVIGRFENFAHDFRRVFTRLGAPSDIVAIAEVRHNATADTNVSDFYDADLAARVYEFYEADFAAFGYDRDSWR